MSLVLPSTELPWIIDEIKEQQSIVVLSEEKDNKPKFNYVNTRVSASVLASISRNQQNIQLNITAPFQTTSNLPIPNNSHLNGNNEVSSRQFHNYDTANETDRRTRGEFTKWFKH